MNTQFDRTLDVKYYLRVVLRRKWVVVVSTVTLVCATLVTLTMVPRRFESSATLLVEDRPMLAREVEQVLGGWQRSDIPALYRDAERTAQILSRLHSRPFLERVVKSLRMTEDPGTLQLAREMKDRYPSLEESEIAVRLLVQGLKSRIEVQPKGSGIFVITVHDLNPANAQLLAKWISELYMDFAITQELEKIRTLKEFGAEQIRVYEGKLRESEDALERFSASMIDENLSSTIIRSGNFTVATTTLDRLKDEATTALVRIVPLSRRVVSAGFDTDENVRLVDHEPEIQSIIARLLSAQKIKINDYLTAAVEGVAAINLTGLDRIRQELYQALESKVARQHPDVPAEDRRVLVNYLFAKADSGVRSKLAAYLESNVNQFRRQSQTEPGTEIELGRLNDEVAKHRQLLESFRAQITATDVSQAVEATNLGLRIEIIDPAQHPLEPSWPKTKKILAFAALLGPLLGVCLVFLSELTDPTLRSIEDIQRIAPEPVLGMIPLMSKRIPRPRSLRRYWVPATLTGILVLTVGFFVARSALFPNSTAASVRAQDPVETAAP